jgi:uncharacterized membrane protein YjgN (DUF898 family)
MSDGAFPFPAGSPERQTGFESLRFDYVPRPGLLKITFVNLIFNILTLTIYRFWARTNIRKHIWSCIHINGQPLEYTGKGAELFKGALIVFCVLGLPTILAVAVVNIAYGPEHPAVGGIQLLLFLIVSLLWGAAVFRARRYQLSRTLWRGIRGWLEGSAVTYSLTYFGAILARGVTLGWSTPVMNVNLQEQIIGGMRFGNLPFTFKGRAGPLYPTFALCWFLMLGVIIAGIVLAIAGIGSVFGDDLSQIFGDFLSDQAEPTEAQSRTIAILIGFAFLLFLAYFALYPMIWAVYTARELTVFASYTKLGTAQFSLNATASSIILLTLGNLILWLFTLGIAAPFIQQRLVRYFCDRIEVTGTVDIDRVLQSKAKIDATGEGLADALDIGGL